MARGTWQGSGTWQTGGGGPDLSGLIPVIVVVGLAAVVAELVATYIWWIVGTAAAVIVLGAAGVTVLLVHRARSERPGRPITARPVYREGPAAHRELSDSYKALEPRPQLEVSHKPAIEPARNEVHLHLNVTPDELAAIVRHYTDRSSP